MGRVIRVERAREEKRPSDRKRRRLVLRCGENAIHITRTEVLTLVRNILAALKK